uniref:Histidine--tRNA ligase, chloroplastic n=1 Tax=Porphyra purpurea TaxID=2787 RepID=SYH_PORPU|nr:histidine-tRNA synthetase [Porphyra purpurea]P51348.1 RecName: Full=Histidine--tRNA ligase, chloroplastic; AltName: Full=Histidyl-tRNA synthetase; Short=HisRS [Porphyra purpurea]AAC08234.1 histidine tRNA synthetase [Porphyra purpurea]
MAKIQAIRGTKDILPDEQLYWQFIHEKVASLLKYANYKEIKTPIFENSDLYDRGIGENTDIVNKEMYRFNDRSNRDITLRPEGTAGVVRAFIENRMDVQNRLQKLWYSGPMFRYERPQSGRQRQFHQLGIEFIGSSDARADAEIIHLAMNIFNDLSVNDLQLDINSIGKAEDRNHYQAKLQEYLEQYYDDLDTDSQNRLSSNPIRILDTKNKYTQTILNDSPRISDFLSLESEKHFDDVCDYLTLLNVPYKINTQLVRGLDYYNDTAFEIKILKSQGQDTLCGGGRYDSLIHQLGGNKTPAVGCAIGLERLLLVAKDNILLPHMSIDCYIVSKGIKARKIGIIITQFLRNQLVKTELDISSSNFGKQLKQAHKKRAIACLILGDNEIQQETITIKWMYTQEQENMSIIEFKNKISYLKKKIAFNKKFNSY